MTRRTLSALSLFVLTSLPMPLPAQEPAASDAPAAAPPKVPFLKPQGAYADLPEMGFSPLDLLSGGGGAPKPFFKLLEAIAGLAAVEEADVLLDLSAGVAFNGPQLRELERTLHGVRQAGKRVVCYLENADSDAYQLASQCDEILLADMAMLDLRSPAMSVMHFKDALDLIGVQVEVTRVGAFKGAVEPYLLPQMSPHLRSHYEAMLATINDDVVRRIAAGRKLEESRVRELQATRLFPAADALEHRLVDRLVAWTGAGRALAAARGVPAVELVDAGPKKKKQSRDLMALISGLLRQDKEEAIEDPQIVVLHLAGQIVDGDKPAAGSMVSGASVERIEALRTNDLVKGVVVRINSPGGSATASEAIRIALARLAEQKPVVFSMGELAASGGYWITAIGAPILAEASTITGSIGVFGMRLLPAALMRRIGVHTDIVRLDDGPLMDAIDRPWSDDARDRMQTFVDGTYARFLTLVGQSRQKPVEEVDAIAGGRVWSGTQALANGLVDAIGGVDDAVAMVRGKAALDGTVEVRHLPEPKNFADSLFSSLFEAQVGAAERAAFVALLRESGCCAELMALVREALTGDGRMRVQAMLPATLRVR
jgi:protease IV